MLQPDGKIVVTMPNSRVSQPVEGFVREYSVSHLALTAQLWTLLGIFALAPLLSSYLDTGIAGLLFTKGLARWQIFFGIVARSGAGGPDLVPRRVRGRPVGLRYPAANGRRRLGGNAPRRYRATQVRSPDHLYGPA